MAIQKHIIAIKFKPETTIDFQYTFILLSLV